MKSQPFYLATLLAISIATSTFLISMTVQAQPAIYRGDTLTIPSGVLIYGDEAIYYNNIELKSDAEGKFLVVAASVSSLAFVEIVDVMILESFPLQVQLEVSGFKSNICVELEETAISRRNNNFTVVLAQTDLRPGESCIEIIAGFQITIPLEVYGLPAGNYTVDVNGVEAEFTLDVDNLL